MNVGPKHIALLAPLVFASLIMIVYLTIRFLYVDIPSRLEKVFWLLSAVFLLTILSAGFWGLVNL